MRCSTWQTLIAVATALPRPAAADLCDDLCDVYAADAGTVESGSAP
jgi:hypothetical protein